MMLLMLFCCTIYRLRLSILMWPRSVSRRRGLEDSGSLWSPLPWLRFVGIAYFSLFRGCVPTMWNAIYAIRPLVIVLPCRLEPPVDKLYSYERSRRLTQVCVESPLSKHGEGPLARRAPGMRRSQPKMLTPGSAVTSLIPKPETYYSDQNSWSGPPFRADVSRFSPVCCVL